ncbi:MAG TPA: hypothetical protein PLH03_01865 [Methylophilaceae bacterium]|nr:hypothetical protein [Methylophilaceae bacterium]
MCEYYDDAGRTDAVRFELPKGNYTIHIEWHGEDPPRQVENSGTAALPRPIDDRLSLAVLPFANMSSDPEQEYFTDGFTDCLITEKSRQAFGLTFAMTVL